MAENQFQSESASLSHRDDPNFLQALRRGDEAAFASLLDQYHGRLLRLAMNFVHNRHVAEEVVQETWVGVIEGLNLKENCNILKISETNQRVLLHRARSKVRQALEQYLERGMSRHDPRRA